MGLVHPGEQTKSTGATDLSHRLGDNSLPGPITDDELRDLFAAPTAPGDFLLFEDGFTSHVPNHSDLSFDSLVDFDPPQPDHANYELFGSGFQPDAQHPETSLPTLAETSCVQPSFGASLDGCDGQGIAAEVR